MLTVGSLFSGIGGLDLGLERAGMEVIWQSEIDPFATKVLQKHWPKVVNHGNIKEIDWKKVERPEVICGGYPCQPFSQAGKRRGEEDPRHLWPWVRDAISELRPRYAILENVRGHLSMGGLTVIGELTDLGYRCEWRVVSAASVGANHRRDRIIIVAYADSGDETNGRECSALPGEDSSWGNDRSGSGSNSREVGLGSSGENSRNVADSDNSRNRTSRSGIDRLGETLEQGRQDKSQLGAGGYGSNVADSNGGRFQECESEPEKIQWVSGGGEQMADSDSFGRLEGESEKHPTERGEPSLSRSSNGGESVADSDIWEAGWRSGSGEQDSRDVFGRENYRRGTAGYDGWQWWAVEPEVGRVAHGVPSRVDRLRGLGNAVVPQVAEVIGRLVMSHAQGR